jgi:hypothetical protein
MIQKDVDRIANWWKHNKDNYPIATAMPLMLSDDAVLWCVVESWEKDSGYFAGELPAPRPAHRAEKNKSWFAWSDAAYWFATGILIGLIITVGYISLDVAGVL